MPTSAPRCTCARPGARARGAPGWDRPRPPVPLAAAQELIEVAPGIVDTWTSYDARELGAAELAATVGNSVSLGISARRAPLRAAAMLRGALGERPAPADAAVAARLDGLVGEWCEDTERQYEPRWVPLTAQTNLHMQTMLAIARELA
ncbi:hypothetical protein CG723_16600 [Streptomyces sp. CB01635]|uniref:hypothetical protein n=1 Tax=unclassified Streptomyces TaxID=2593676 RepID=UPI000C27613F|nr:hypothetical protein [Streptomyces sp. CB01635]PJN10797.1 hypothetical protein CG723_16600 [Streptomyces sp. CB01635]